MLDDVLDYARPGPFTSFDEAQAPPLAGLPDDPVALCAAAQGLVVQPGDATEAGLPDEWQVERNIRPMGELVDLLLARSPRPLTEARPLDERVVGTCRHFAVLACAFLRFRGIPARARCGFATYFQRGLHVDHWVVEYRHPEERRWVRIDPEILGQQTLERPEDLVPGQFLTGGEAWGAYRRGAVDGATFGVWGTEHAWGPGEIRGNAVRDLASLRRVETLPWDEWGRMTASYAGETGADYDELIDAVAAACAADGAEAIARLCAVDDLAVPAALLDSAVR
ncbi:MAG: transglutaminase domain-containing protein [Acidothermales bacterium]|nr:transglutaminase domain-containing protein [Acidothermales bacterium]